jgi:hypothetical protein
MEVTDPYTNTTTVKNILQHIVVPKIVSDGTSGYVTKTDLVNVHNLIFTGNSTTVGTPTLRNNSQTGTFPTSAQDTIVYHSRVTTNSIIFAVTLTVNTTGYYPSYVRADNGSFVVHLANDPPAGTNVTIGWFISRF